MMVDLKGLDTIYRVYNADLSNIMESASRTYGEANVFYKMAVVELTNFLAEMNDSYWPRREELYDEINAVATILAASCEMYLKALYLYEHKDDGLAVDELWNKLRNSEFKVDEKGNPVYEKELPDGKKVTVFAMYDDNGEIVRDRFGKVYWQVKETYQFH